MARPSRTPLTTLTGIEQAIRAAIPPGEYEIVYTKNTVTAIPHDFHGAEIHVDLNIKLVRRYEQWQPPTMKTVKQVIAENEEVTEPERRIVFAEQP